MSKHNFKQGDKIEIIAGKHKGKAAWFWMDSRKKSAEPHVFIQFVAPNLRGAHLKLSDIVAAS